MVNHCNNCITPYTPEQARDKQRSWVCTNQLLINKMILDELKHHCRDLLIIWFGYKKTFDSAPHNWILQALELAHVPSKIKKCHQRVNEYIGNQITPKFHWHWCHQIFDRCSTKRLHGIGNVHSKLEPTVISFEQITRIEGRTTSKTQK